MEKLYPSSVRQPLLRFFVKSIFQTAFFVFAFFVTGAQTTDTAGPQSNALLFVENLDRFPSNDVFVFSRVQVPFTRDTVYNANHDSLAVRIRNKGLNNLVITSLTLGDTAWKFVKLKGVDYDSASLPLTIAPGTFADLTVQFVAVDTATRVKVLYDTLTIVSNDDKFPEKKIYLNGLLQRQGEGSNEPWAQEIINAFGYKTRTGFNRIDPDAGDSTKLKGDEIRPSFFVRADTTRPVTVRQMAAYHGCCHRTERIVWYAKGSTTTRTILTHLAIDAQSVLPRKNASRTAGQSSFTPQSPFGFIIGYVDNTDARRNPGRKIGIRVWKAFDPQGNIIPNSYIIANDYLGSSFTNYDYNDNMYFISNVRPERGTAAYSALSASPSDVDFGEHVLQTSSSFQLKLTSLGKTYPDLSSDPPINISSIQIVGENQAEFSASMPVKKTLNAQDSTTLTIDFKPESQGLKIADLLIYYNNSLSPLRVPLYGIGRAADTTVVVNYRINSGSTQPLTIDGKTWAADNQYAFDNLEPYTNPQVREIAATDDDSLYFKEQSSNGDKRPFRYELPVENGEYVVRLHFAEIYWGAPGSGINGGTGSRVMNVSLENQLRLVNFDVFQESGGVASALIKNLPVTVTDGKLDINFTANVNRPMVVAVEVVSFRASAVLSSEGPRLNILPGDNGLKKPKVYPNPISKRFKVEFPSQYSGNTTLQISDNLGRLYNIGRVKLQRGRINTTEIDVSGFNFKPGFYSLRVLSETRPADMIKLIVQ